MTTERIERMKELVNKIEKGSMDLVSVLNEVPGLIVLWRGHRIMFSNSAFQKVVGLDEARLWSTPWEMLIHPDDRGVTIDHAADKERSTEPITIRLISIEGNITTVSWSTLPPTPSGYSFAIGSVI